jgi:hypothetical protein
MSYRTCFACANKSMGVQNRCSHVKCCRICYLDDDSGKLACSHAPIPTNSITWIADTVDFDFTTKPDYSQKAPDRSINPYYPNNSVVGLHLPANKCMKCPYGRFLGINKKCSLCENTME